MIYFDEETRQFSSVEDREFGLTTRVGAGAGAGAAIGSVVPVVGTGIGAAIGAGVGATSHAIEALKTRRREKAIAKAAGKLADMHMDKWHGRREDAKDKRDGRRDFILKNRELDITDAKDRRDGRRDFILKNRELNKDSRSDLRGYLLDKKRINHGTVKDVYGESHRHTEAMKDKRVANAADRRRSSYLHRERN